MTPEEALALAKTIGDIYGEATTQLVAAISRAVARGVDAPDWATRQLADTLRLRAETGRLVQQLRDATAAQIPALIEQAYRGGSGTIFNPRAVEALAADTIRLLNDTLPRVLRWSEDVYRQTVAETIGPAVTGATTRRDAAAATVERLTARGVTGLTDAAGRRWGLDTYAEQATRTAVGRAHMAGTVAGYLEQGREYVVVSDSPEECPQCRPYEGTILSLGADLPPPDGGNGLRYAGTLAAARANGLGHPNCTHRLGAYIPGLTKPMGDVSNPVGYELRQRQRALERRVRESKRRVEALTPLGSTPTLARQQALLRDRRRRLREFVAEHDRKAYVSKRRVRLDHR